jgi:hypothetical protein
MGQTAVSGAKPTLHFGQKTELKSAMENPFISACISENKKTDREVSGKA